jgi:uncharacterized caspase-like protein
MGNNWAIVVGVNDYEHHPEQKLRYAVRDAERLGDFLCQSAQFEAVNVIRCLGEETRRNERNYPSCSNLFRILNRDLKPSNIGQVQHLWFFFSGHGISRNGRDFLVPSDCLEEDLDRFLLPVDEVIAALRLHQKAEIVLILDACREKIGSKGKGSIGTQTVEFAKERGVTTIFSCGYGQLSYELEALQQGAFTHALVEGLGQFTLPFQLEPFLQQRVNELHQEAQKSVTQTPKIQTDSIAKAFQSLLPDCVTTSDVTFLIEQAKEAELEEKFDDAKRWFRQVVEVSPLPTQRQAAFKALDRIDGKIARQKSNSDVAAASQQYNIYLEKGATYVAPSASQLAEKVHYNINLEEGATFITPSQEAKIPDEPLLSAIEEPCRVPSSDKCCRLTPYGTQKLEEVFKTCDHIPTDSYIADICSLDRDTVGQIRYQRGFVTRNSITRLFEALDLDLSPEDYTRVKNPSLAQSPLNEIPLESEKGIDYRKLRDLLKDGRWEEADRETLAVMLQAANRKSEGWLDADSLKQFPCKDLRTIDQLWVLASNGHFGFSVQKKIWEECGSPMSSGKAWDRFCVRVSWQDSAAKDYVDYSDLKKDPLISPKGVLPIGMWSKGDWDFEQMKINDYQTEIFSLSTPLLFSRAKTCEL